jgi:hypothetical protein
MTSPDRAASYVEDAFSEALGHIRNATERLLGDDEQSTNTLLLGLSCLDLQGMFGDVWPGRVPNERTPSESLACAEATLGEVLDHVPLAVWAALRSLRERVGDGHR